MGLIDPVDPVDLIDPVGLIDPIDLIDPVVVEKIEHLERLDLPTQFQNLTACGFTITLILAWLAMFLLAVANLVRSIVLKRP